MTVVGKSWNRLTLPGKVIFTVVPLLVVVTVVAVAAIVLLGPAIVDILAANLPILRFVIAVTVVLLMTVPTAFLIIYMEMKIIALMNLRIGPDRVGRTGRSRARAASIRPTRSLTVRTSRSGCASTTRRSSTCSPWA